MMVDAEDLVIRKEIHVDAPVERAFEVFTEGMPDWWPMETHSMAELQGYTSGWDTVLARYVSNVDR